MNDVNLAPENKEATPEHGYLMAYDKKEQKAKGVKGIAANGELETLEANEANRDQFIKVDQRGKAARVPDFDVPAVTAAIPGFNDFPAS